MAVFLTFYYPHFMALVFLAFYFAADIPAKGRFLLRASLAIGIALTLAHLNRLFDLWPAHRFFASGHMTFSLGVALSLGMLRPWTLAITLPLLIPFGMALIVLHFHDPEDVLGAIPLVLGVYWAVHSWWSEAFTSPPLDRVRVSP